MPVRTVFPPKYTQIIKLYEKNNANVNSNSNKNKIKETCLNVKTCENVHVKCIYNMLFKWIYIHCIWTKAICKKCFMKKLKFFSISDIKLWR